MKLERDMVQGIGGNYRLEVMVDNHIFVLYVYRIPKNKENNFKIQWQTFLS